MSKMYSNSIFLIRLRCLRHAFTIIGLVMLFPGLSFAQATYLRLETMMDTDARRLTARIPGQAAIRWETIASHPSLPGDRARIALAALLYGRILFAHEETRVELFARVERAARGLAEDGSIFKVDTWDLQAGGMSYPIWPWRLVGPGELTSAKTYVATLIGSHTGELFGIRLDMAFGLERVLAPASALVTLSAVSQELDRNGRILLGQVLLAMNGHYGTPQAISRPGSEVAALRAALPLLLVGVSPPEERERIVNKQDADRIFRLSRSQWEAEVKQMVHPSGWKVRLSPVDTGTGVIAFDSKTGMGLAVQPLFQDMQSPPEMLVVGSYYPAGTFPDFSERLKRNMEAAARSDLGPAYSVSISFKRMASPPPGFDVVEVIITSAQQ